MSPLQKMRADQQLLNDVETGRWVVSYADFITLLFAFFVVMYSISSVNDGKFRVLSDSMVTVFNQPTHRPVPIDLGGTTQQTQSEPLAQAAIEEDPESRDIRPLDIDETVPLRERV